MSARRGRWLVVAAATFWSLSGAFTKLLTFPDDRLAAAPLGLAGWGLNTPPVDGLRIALFRTLFAGLALLPLVRPRAVTFRPGMALMALSFAAMNALYVSAMAQDTAANAVFLQYTAPVWLALAGWLFLHEPPERRQVVTLIIAMTGVGVIVADACHQPSLDTLRAVLYALGSGVTFAGVILGLRIYRAHSAPWLTVLNHLAGGLALLPILLWRPWPTPAQLGFLVVFGTVQMGLPYALMTRGLQGVSAQEAGTICLLEPLLNPVWAYLVAGEVPELATLVGGAFILGALLWQYAPRPTPPRPSG
jgi:drug/metabolite transporter (DMT)-like permease